MGERSLFIGGFARRIVGLSGDESRDILRVRQNFVTRPEHVLRWSWSHYSIRGDASGHTPVVEVSAAA